MNTRRTWVAVPLGFLGLIFSFTTHAVQDPLTTKGEHRPSLDLSGEWEFKLDPLDAGRAGRWFKGTVPFERTIRVPGAWNAQGVAFESKNDLREYEEERLEEQKALNNLGVLGKQRESARLFHVHPGPGWYRKKVTIPAAWKGKVP